MLRMIQMTALTGLLVAAACSDSQGTVDPNDPSGPQGRNINTPNIEHYTTDHNGYSRARISNARGPNDNAVLAQFDDGNPRDPAGYRNLIALTEDRYRDDMQLQVVAQVTMQNGEEQVVRILRLTADQAPFDNVDAAGNTIASGEFYFRGSAEVYATVDGGALQRGVGDLENMIVDFDSESVFINIRTPFNPGGGSDIETQINVDGIPFNVVTGEFGGPVTMTTRSGVTGEVITTRGSLRGNLSASEDNLRYHDDNVTTSGLFTIGSDTSRVQADGIFWGRHPNTFN